MSKPNHHAKETQQALESIGFAVDHDASRPGSWVYRHPNEPDRPLTVFAGLTEIAARKIRIKGDDIAGLSSHGESIPKTVGETARFRREERKRKEAAEAERGARERAARAESDRLREQQIEARQRARARENELREFRRLMGDNPGWA